jgi:hypothetical protein
MRIRLHHLSTQLDWKHVLGETVMIVFSILIALAANSWWQDREDRRTELEILREMRAALVLDREDLRSDLSAYTAVDRASHLLLEHVERGEPYSPALDTSFADLLVFRIHLSNSSPYESIRSRGLGLISNDSLRLGVIDFYGLTNSSVAIWNTADTRLVDDAIRPYFRGRFRLGIRRGSGRRYATPIDYQAVAADPIFRGLLMDRLGFTRLTIPQYRAAIEDAEHLIGMIDLQVKRLE